MFQGKTVNKSRLEEQFDRSPSLFAFDIVYKRKEYSPKKEVMVSVGNGQTEFVKFTLHVM